MLGINKHTFGIVDAIASKFHKTTGRTLSAADLYELSNWLEERPWFLEIDENCTITFEEDE